MAAPMNNPSRSLRVSPGATLLLVLFWFVSAGCKTRDMSRHPSRVTDYRIGQIYQLKVPAFIVGKSGLVMTVEGSDAHPPREGDVFLEPGTYLTVRQVIAVKDRQPRTEIYAEITSGPNKGRVVNLRTASLGDGPPGSTRRNPAVLEPFFLTR